MEEFGYLEVLSMRVREVRLINKRIDAIVVQVLYQTAMVKREKRIMAKLWIYQLIYVLPLIYRHEFWLVTERMDRNDQDGFTFTGYLDSRLDIRKELRDHCPSVSLKGAS